jgi:hypothetical protein
MAKEIVLMTTEDFALLNDEFGWMTNEEQIRKYVLFLRRTKELWMFIPCDEKGKPMKEPLGTKTYLKSLELNVKCSLNEDAIGRIKEYLKAKDRVLFKIEGIKLVKHSRKYEPYLYADLGDGKEFFMYAVDMTGTIKDLIGYKFPLTEAAKKEIGYE